MSIQFQQQLMRYCTYVTINTTDTSWYPCGVSPTSCSAGYYLSLAIIIIKCVEIITCQCASKFISNDVTFFFSIERGWIREFTTRLRCKQNSYYKSPQQSTVKVSGVVYFA